MEENTSYIPYLVALAILILLVGIAGAYYRKIWLFVMTRLINQGDVVRLAEVIEGDTILVNPVKDQQQSWTVRLIGVDTPESQKSLYMDEAPFGKEALEFVRERLMNEKELYLIYDQKLYDKFEKRLAYLYLQTGECLNETLLEQGYGWIRKHSFEVRKMPHYEQLQQKARQQSKNVWEIYVNKGILREEYKQSEAYKDYKKRIEGDKE